MAILLTGSYNLNAIDENGCIANTIFSINEPPAFVYTTSSTDESCFPPDGQAQIDVTGRRNGRFVLQLEYSIRNKNTFVANNLSSGNYLVTSLPMETAVLFRSLCLLVFHCSFQSLTLPPHRHV